MALFSVLVQTKGLGLGVVLRDAGVDGVFEFLDGEEQDRSIFQA
jgi:hypothetical protein